MRYNELLLRFHVHKTANKENKKRTLKPISVFMVLLEPETNYPG